MVYASRNDAFGFAQRTRKNLAYIEKTFAEGADVHVVTQLVVSLLGLVVFPTERNVVRRLKTLNLSELESLGWPRWEFETTGDRPRIYDRWPPSETADRAGANKNHIQINSKPPVPA
jgi:hypothetical protein